MRTSHVITSFIAAILMPVMAALGIEERKIELPSPQTINAKGILETGKIKKFEKSELERLALAVMNEAYGEQEYKANYDSTGSFDTLRITGPGIPVENPLKFVIYGYAQGNFTQQDEPELLLLVRLISESGDFQTFGSGYAILRLKVDQATQEIDYSRVVFHSLGAKGFAYPLLCGTFDGMSYGHPDGSNRIFVTRYVDDKEKGPYRAVELVSFMGGKPSKESPKVFPQNSVSGIPEAERFYIYRDGIDERVVENKVGVEKDKALQSEREAKEKEEDRLRKISYDLLNRGVEDFLLNTLRLAPGSYRIETFPENVFGHLQHQFCVIITGEYTGSYPKDDISNDFRKHLNKFPVTYDGKTFMVGTLHRGTSSWGYNSSSNTWKLCAIDVQPVQ